MELRRHACGIGRIDRVIGDQDVLRLADLDGLAPAGDDEVVADDAAGHVRRLAGGVAEADAPVAVEDEVPLGDDVLAVDPDEDGPAPPAVAPTNADEDVVGDDPVLQPHHVHAADVVAAERARVRVDVVVDEQAVAHLPAGGADLFHGLRRVPPPVAVVDPLGVGALESADPAVVELDVVDLQPLHVAVAVEQDAVLPGVGDGQVGDQHVLRAPDLDDPAELPAAVEDHLVAVAAGAAEAEAVGADPQAVDIVPPVGQEDGRSRLGGAGGGAQLFGGLHADDRARRLRQRRRLGRHLPDGPEVELIGCRSCHLCSGRQRPQQHHRRQRRRSARAEVSHG